MSTTSRHSLLQLLQVSLPAALTAPAAAATRPPQAVPASAGRPPVEHPGSARGPGDWLAIAAVGLAIAAAGVVLTRGRP